MPHRYRSSTNPNDKHPTCPAVRLRNSAKHSAQVRFKHRCVLTPCSHCSDYSVLYLSNTQYPLTSKPWTTIRRGDIACDRVCWSFPRETNPNFPPPRSEQKSLLSERPPICTSDAPALHMSENSDPVAENRTISYRSCTFRRGKRLLPRLALVTSWQETRKCENSMSFSARWVRSWRARPFPWWRGFRCKWSGGTHRTIPTSWLRCGA